MNGPANKIVTDGASARVESHCLARLPSPASIPPSTHLDHAYSRRNNDQSRLIPPNPAIKNFHRSMNLRFSPQSSTLCGSTSANLCQPVPAVASGVRRTSQFSYQLARTWERRRPAGEFIEARMDPGHIPARSGVRCVSPPHFPVSHPLQSLYVGIGKA